jgi:ribonuclease HI
MDLCTDGVTYGSVVGACMDAVNGEIDERQYVHVCVCVYLCMYVCMEKEKCYIEFKWIKAHEGHSGNEQADKLPKKAAKNSEICYNKIPKSEIVRQESQKPHRKMATKMGRHHKRTGNQGILPRL